MNVRASEKCAFERELTMVEDVVWKPEEKCIGNKLVEKQSKRKLHNSLQR
jgi:hypothetical protein